MIPNIQHVVFPVGFVVVICRSGKSICSNAGYTVWDDDACQAGAIIESLVFNARHALRKNNLYHRGADKCMAPLVLPCAVRDGDTRQAVAGIESIIPDTGHAIWDSDVCQAAATRERRIPNAGHTIRDGDARQAVAAIESLIPNAGDAIRDGDARQAVAVRESRIPNAGDAIRDGNARQAAIATKCIGVYRRNTVRDLQMGHFFVVQVQFRPVIQWIGSQIIEIDPAPGRHVRDAYTCRTGAAIESLIPNAGDAIRDGDARQAGAARESRIPNARYTILYHHMQNTRICPR